MNIGIDIEECERFKSVHIEKIFSAAELEYIKQRHMASETIAGLYCAKEAYGKAKGFGILKSRLPEIEVAHDENGKPYYKNDKSAVLSISHTKATAVAVCIIL